MEEQVQKNELFLAVKFRNWDRVLEIFEEHPEIQDTKITTSHDTALHVAITHGVPEDIVRKLIDEIKRSRNAIETLSAKNDREDTPLHCAASRGSQLMCHRITSVEKSLVEKRNKEGETPLFLAALDGHKKAFLYLHSVCSNMENSSLYWRRGNGDTILHCTIQRKHFELSFLIIQLYKVTAGSVNEEGKTPLDILASTPSAFRSGTHLEGWEKLCYNFIRVDKLKFDPPVESNVVDVEHSEAYQNQSQDAPVRFRSILGSIRKKKERHVWGAQIMEELVKHDCWYDSRLYEMQVQEMEHDDDLNDILCIHPTCCSKSVNEGKQNGKGKTSTALLTAARYGLIELVKNILDEKSIAIYDRTIDNKNIVLVAAEKGQSRILKEIMKHQNWNVLRNAVDDHGNNALHLAAMAKPEHTPSGGSSTFMEMQWDINWFEYVKKKMPPYFTSQFNKDGKTPGNIFGEEHKELIHKSNKWVKETSGNYIVAATLIAGATFTTCNQIPGGYDGHDGTPIVGSHPMFNIFAISALVSFCLSITALAAFLAIYSSRNDKARHYRRTLPLQLCFGLSLIYFSVTSMLVSFCVAHTFEIDPRNKYNLIPVYGTFLFTAFCFYAATQAPLHAALFKASFYVPHPRPIYEEEQDYVQA